MKTKAITGKIGETLDLVKSIKKDGEFAGLGSLRKPLQTLVSDLESAVGMQNDMKKLKKDLKSLKKKLEKQAKKLAEGQKAVKKIYRKAKKAGTQDKIAKVARPVTVTKPQKKKPVARKRAVRAKSPRANPER